MKILNIHSRVINKPLLVVSELMNTLASHNDQVWPNEKWPAMKFKGGIKVGAKGGHGPIRYTVEEYNTDQKIKFLFTKPKGFKGSHWIEIKALSENQTE